MKIQKLSTDIINQISAGEVVERPAHLVKELIENSLDAGATQIHIEVKNGARFLKVKDNGSGITKEELGLALERHATSKIQKADDLWSLATYGFRGEALASASAVSLLTLRSFHKNSQDPQGYQLQSSFGQRGDIKPSSILSGTEVIVDSLFENVPARLKFLKSAAAEVQQIRQVIKALALIYTQVELKLTVEGELDLYFPVQDLELKRVQSILNIEELFYYENSYLNFKCRVYFASPHHVQKTSKNIWIFAQKRWIQDRGLQTAVIEAYRSLLMHGEYPQAVIDLSCSPEEIDVNIHPTKSQVKFLNASYAFKCVHGTLRRALELAPWHQPQQNLAQLTCERKEPLHRKEESLRSELIETEKNMNYHFFQSHLNQQDPTQFKTKMSVKDQVAQLNVLSPSVTEFLSTPATEGLSGVSLQSGVLAESQFYKPKESLPNQGMASQKSYWSDLQVIGQMNLTYIVCQKNDRMILVDQHAAHERVAFERLMKAWKENRFEVQDYLFPLVIDLSQEKIEALMAHEHDLLRMGIKVEQLSPQSLGVVSAPLIFKERAIAEALEKMAHDVLEYGGSYSVESTMSERLATMACHSVIRAGQSLSYDEMVSLLKQMDEFSFSSFCPHGRPVSIEMTFYDIEKKFGRIV